MLELAAIEPDKAAIFAGVDDHVAGSRVEMSLHAMAALGACDLALQIAAIGRWLRRCAALPFPQLVDE